VSADGPRRWWLRYFCVFATPAAALPILPAAARPAVVLVCGVAVVAALLTGIRLFRPVNALGWYALVAAVVTVLLVGLVAPMLDAADLMRRSPLLDAVYYLSYPVYGLALTVLPTRGRPGSRFAGLTEAAIITTGALVVWWAFIIDPVVMDSSVRIQQVHVLVYPILDVAVLALGLRLLILAGFSSPAFTGLTVSTAAVLVGDLIVFELSGDGLVIGAPPVAAGSLWLFAFALVGAAALHPSMARPAPAARDGDEPDAIGAARIYVVTVIATPILTGAFLLHELGDDRLATLDIVVPVGATALIAALVVSRMRQINQLARRRAIALEQSLGAEERLRDEMRRRAQHDELTGLPNRSLLYDRVTAALAAGTPGALFVLDLDNFKDVNDRFGYALGDDLLGALARRLREMSADRALVARLDGGEFAVLLAPASAGEAPRRAQEMVVTMRRPVQVQGQEVFATVSVGVRELDSGLLTGDVLRDAYLALHSAKAAGRDQAATFDSNLLEQRLATARTVDRLRGAIERDELLMHYQPLVRLADEHLVGVEALIRWQPAGERMIPPDRFIPAAEDSGLIVPIGAWVLRRSCEAAAPWHRRYGAVVSVNVSPRQLREPDFATQVLDALRASALPPAALILEITEGVLVASGTVTEQAIRHLTTLRDKGVRVAVDDFGTGYSSLAYLRDLPIDHIKIDKSFMPPPGAVDQASRTLVKAIIDLAAGLGLGTIAEGVETLEQVELLRELGCERAQGFYFARPVPEAEAAEMLGRTGRAARV
jgi:diguanylate cyclase (GGDEF)-like protein